MTTCQGSSSATVSLTLNRSLMKSGLELSGGTHALRSRKKWRIDYIEQSQHCVPESGGDRVAALKRRAGARRDRVLGVESDFQPFRVR
jgi:hypothetical protein